MRPPMNPHLYGCQATHIFSIPFVIQAVVTEKQKGQIVRWWREFQEYQPDATCPHPISKNIYDIANQ